MVKDGTAGLLIWLVLIALVALLATAAQGAAWPRFGWAAVDCEICRKNPATISQKSRKSRMAYLYKYLINTNAFMRARFGFNKCEIFARFATNEMRDLRPC